MDSPAYTMGYAALLVLIIILICYLFKKSHPAEDFIYFDCPPPPGASAAEIREFNRWKREKRINRQLPAEGYQPLDKVTTEPPAGGSGVPSHKDYPDFRTKDRGPRIN